MMKKRLYDEIGQYTTIPNSVIEMWPEIGMDAFGLFVCLRYHTNKDGEAFPSYDCISKETGMGRHRISAAIKVLRRAGLLECQRRFSSSTIYTLKLPAISAAQAPMDGAPLVPNQTSISAESALPLVPNQPSNQTHLTKLNQPELKPEKPKRSGKKLYTTTEATLLYLSITGFAAVPASNGSAQHIDNIVALLNQVGEDDAHRRLVAAWEGWKQSKTKDGRAYSRSNMAWIDYAITDDVPNSTPAPGASNQVTKNSDGSVYA